MSMEVQHPNLTLKRIFCIVHELNCLKHAFRFFLVLHIYIYTNKYVHLCILRNIFIEGKKARLATLKELCIVSTVSS